MALLGHIYFHRLPIANERFVFLALHGVATRRHQSAITFHQKHILYVPGLADQNPKHDGTGYMHVLRFERIPRYGLLNNMPFTILRRNMDRIWPRGRGLSIF